jgi:hypothetical protein
MFKLIFPLSVLIDLKASFIPVFVFNNFSNYKKDIKETIQLLENEGYSPKQIVKIMGSLLLSS